MLLTNDIDKFLSYAHKTNQFSFGYKLKEKGMSLKQIMITADLEMYKHKKKLKTTKQ